MIIIENIKTSRVRFHLTAILFITVIIAYFDRINVSMLAADPKFLSDMGIANNSVAKGLLMSVFLMFYGVGNVTLGALGDRIGPRKAMMVAIISWSISCILGGLSSIFSAALTVFLIGRAILGIGEGLHWPMQSVYIKNWFPNNERGKANSSYFIGMNMASVIGMPLFSGAILALGWVNTMYAMATAGIIPLILLWFFTTDHPHQHKRISKTELEYIETALENEKLEEQAKGVAKTSAKENIKIFISDYRFWMMVIYYTCAGMILWGVMAWLPSYLKDARGFSWATMGMLASLPFIMRVLSTVLAGYFSDKFGRRGPFMAIAGFGAATCIFFSAIVANNWASAVWIALGMGFSSFGSPAMYALLQSMIPSNSVGAGAGMVNGIALGLSALAPLTIGAIIGMTGSYSSGLMFLVACGLTGGTTGLILSLKERTKVKDVATKG